MDGDAIWTDPQLVTAANHWQELKNITVEFI